MCHDIFVVRSDNCRYWYFLSTSNILVWYSVRVRTSGLIEMWELDDQRGTTLLGNFFQSEPLNYYSIIILSLFNGNNVEQKKNIYNSVEFRWRAATVDKMSLISILTAQNGFVAISRIMKRFMEEMNNSLELTKVTAVTVDAQLCPETKASIRCESILFSAISLML